jgi:hypothetical protein
MIEKYYCFMKVQYIRLADVLQQMERLDEKGMPCMFDMKFVTANRQQCTGGEIIEIKGGRKCVGKRGDKVIFDTRPSTQGEPTGKSRDPRHWVNSTRNILLPNGQIRKVHIRLIIEFNACKVCF